MFETLFTYPKVLARHLNAPAAADRERYLTHCASQGMAHATLAGRASELLVVAERLDVTAGRSFTQRDIEAAAEKWVRHQRRRGRIDNPHWSRQWFIHIATNWLGFIERLALPDSERNLFQSQLDDFLACSEEEHGLSLSTISGRRWQVGTFLRSIASCKLSIGSITVRDVDAYLDRKGRQGWCRVSVATCATALRSFFYHAEMRGWCAGVDINTIRGWLGHVSLQTTNIYAEVDFETKAKALAKCEAPNVNSSAKRWREQPALMEFLRSI